MLPGLEAEMDWYAVEEKTSSGVYAKREISIASGKGATLFDEAGFEYIDCVGGQGAANLGHAHPLIQQALQKQAGILTNCPEMFHSPLRAEYQQRLIKKVGFEMDRVFLCNSGTEAIEAALKFAKILTGKKEIIAAKRCFHGRTMGALSATWNKKYREPFEPLVPGTNHMSFNNIDDLQSTINENTAAVLLEIVQGEGGVYLIEPEFLMAVRQLCDQYGALLIVDEVQTGFGRTGAFLAIDHFKITPDLICLAKSIGGGVPMGAVLLNERLDQLPKGIHGSTFGGNPLACAAGLAALDILEAENLVQKSKELGEYFINEILKIESPLIREVRGKGLMVGLELKTKVMPIIRKFQEKGVLVLPTGMSVIRFLPPLVITKEALTRVVEVVSEVLNDEV